MSASCKYRLATLLIAVIAVMAGGARAQFLRPPDNFVTDGVPPISEELVGRLQVYTDFKPSSAVAWHPTQPSMLIRTRINNTMLLHLVSAPGVKPVPVTEFPDGVSGASFQPHKGEYVLFEKARRGNGAFQIYRLDLATKALTAISDSKERAGTPAWNRKGDRIVFATTTIDRNNETRTPVTRLVLSDPLKPDANIVIATLEGGRWSDFRFSPDDRTLVFTEYVSANESQIWMLNMASGEKRRITSPKKADSSSIFYGAPKFSRDGKKLFALSDRASEHRRLVVIDLATSAETVLTPKLPFDVSEYAISTAAKRIAFITNEDGTSVLRFLDLGSFAELPRPALLPGQISALRWRGKFDDEQRTSSAKSEKTEILPTGGELAFTVSSARSPGDVYSWNIATTKIVRWTNGGNPSLSPLDFVEPKLVHWKSFDGLTISGFLYQPDARKFPGKRPVLINIHGGPESQARPGFIGRFNYLVNESGIAMLYPNVRGSSGFGKTFLTLDNGRKREDSVKDVGALLDWIRDQVDLDASKILVMGGSYGGYMALAVASHYSDRISGAIDTAGIANWATFLANTETYRRDLRRSEYGDERDPDMRKFLDGISPLNNVKKIRKPLFIVQGKRDLRVPVAEKEQMVMQLKAQNTPVWFLMANDEGHGFTKKSNADFLFYTQIKFIEQTLMR